MKEIWELSAEERFHRNWIHCPPSDCWIWIGQSKQRKKRGYKDYRGLEYGRFTVFGKKIAVHRFSYELHKGPIPEGLVIDHLCRTTLCVNPNHLEAVTSSENLRRGAEFWRRPENLGKRRRKKPARKLICKQGHIKEEDNIRILTSGSYACRKCIRIGKRRQRNERSHTIYA